MAMKTWLRHGYSIAAANAKMTDHLVPSWRELSTIFKDEDKVPVRFVEKEVEIGNESGI